MEQRPVCLTIGGSDSCGGAGIQADLRVFEALNVTGCSATTALTAQNPETIHHIQASSIQQFEAELDAIINFYDVICIKTGMLLDDAHLQTLVASIQSMTAPHPMLIVDPVLTASSGKHLFEESKALGAYQSLIPLATVWTPNLQEASFFLAHEISDPFEAVSELLLAYRTPVLLKGGHGNGQVLRDIFCDIDGNIDILEHPKQSISRNQSHGTGCRLASAIAAYLAQGKQLTTAVAQAHQWLQNNLQT